MDCSTFLGKAVFLAGDNCGEVDEVACRALGIDEPNHLKLSRQLHVFQSGFRVDGDTPRASVMPRAFLKRRFKSMGGLRLWSNPRACSMCRYLFRDLQRMPASLREVMTGIRLLPHFIRGAEIIMGSNPSFVRERETVICVGECTRAIAEENGYIHVPGCPPARRQLVNALRGNVKKQRGGRGPDDT